MKRPRTGLKTMLRAGAGVAMLGLTTGWAAMRAGAPSTCSLEHRLRAFSSHGLPLREPVRVHWNENQVPFIEAQTDHDLAVTLGAVHAHLRLGQIELMRRIAKGRLAEAFGPAAVPVDYALRLLNMERAVPAIAAKLPQETLVWLAGFAEGLNAFIEQRSGRPYDMALLGLEPQPWTVHDLICLSRLAAGDFTWRVWLRLIRLRQRTDWTQLWERLVGSAAMPVPSFAGGTLEFFLGAFDHGGSNSLAVSAERSASGAPLIASDPHLPIMLPNLWLIGGYKSPSHHAVGLMIPGVPAIALGRNPWIAWGGTSLHAASSDLIDVSDLPAHQISTRREEIAVRWGRPQEVVLRETPYGPLITDARFFGVRRHKPLALRWMGHHATDELSALLAVGRARSWEEFLSALEGFAIPAQNMVFADARGHIGQAMAAQLPSRPHVVPQDMIEKASAIKHWDQMVGCRDLPHRLDPPEGFVASANNTPERAKVAIGFFFSPDDRVQRLRQLLGAPGKLSRDRLVAVQNDVEVPSAAPLRDVVLGVIDEPGSLEKQLPVVDALRGWDGAYSIDSEGALAFELIAYHFILTRHGRRNLAAYLATWDPWALLREDLAHTDRARVRRAVHEAARRAQPAYAKLGCWGNAHRLRLTHAFGSAPLIGGRFRFADLPVAGSNETVMKTAYGFAPGKHRVRLGANARHISDLADLDANWFVLLGGQDGWLGSVNFLDQLPLWREKKMIQVPLRPESVAAAFPHLTTLMPAPRPIQPCSTQRPS